MWRFDLCHMTKRFSAPLISALELVAVDPGQDIVASQIPSGNRQVDRIRKEVVVNRTDGSNSQQRLSVLFMWYRLLLHQGIDLKSFDSVRYKLLVATGKELYRTIDEGYRVLERVTDHPVRIESVIGQCRTARASLGSDWPVYHGNPAQTGFTDDPGPICGELLWRFPILNYFAAPPLIEAGRVYVASPGMATLMYCLDEKTGNVLRRSWQYSTSYHHPLPADSKVTASGKNLVVRRLAGNGGTVQIVLVNRATGKIVRTLPAKPSEMHWMRQAKREKEFIVYKGGDARSVVVKLAVDGRTWWTFHVGKMFGEPVLKDGRVYAGTDSGLLYALNLHGSERVAWTFQAPTSLRSTPTVVNDRVFVGATDGTFYAINAATGALQWKHLTPREDRAFQLFSLATVADGRVYVGSASRNLYCLDESSGILLWKFDVGSWIRSRPLIVNGIIFVATVDGYVQALKDAHGGVKAVWKQKVSDGIYCDLVGDTRGLLVETADLYLISMSIQDGHIKWKHSLLECAYVRGRRVLADVRPNIFQSSPTIAHGRVYIGGPNRFVFAIDAVSGKELWRFETSGKVSAAPTVAEGLICFGEFGGNQNFYAVDSVTGKPKWSRALGYAWASAAYSDGHLYVGTTQGSFYCLRASDGAIMWHQKVGGGIYTSPAVDEKTVYFGSWDGYYYALGKDTGELHWAYSRPGYPYQIGGRPDSASPVIWKGMLLVQVLGRNMVALDKTTGQCIWEFPAPSMHLLNATAAAYDNRVFASVFIEPYSCPSGASLYALDDSTGRTVWRYDGLGGLTSPAISRNGVYVGSTSSVFFTALSLEVTDKAIPRVLWRYQLDGVIEESLPAISGNIIYVMSSDGYLYAIR